MVQPVVRRRRRSVIVSPRPTLLCTVTALSCRCCTAGSAAVVSLHRRYCAVSVIAPSSHRRAADVNDILEEFMDDDVKKLLRKITINSWIK